MLCWCPSLGFRAVRGSRPTAGPSPSPLLCEGYGKEAHPSEVSQDFCNRTQFLHGPLCPARKAGILEGHPGRETAGQNLKLVLVVVGSPHPALNPSKPPEGPPSPSSSGGKRSCAEWGCRRSRAGTLGHSEWLPAPEPSAQNRAWSRLWSGEGKHLSFLFFFFSSKNKNLFPPPEFNSSPVKGRSASATYNLKTKKKGRRGRDTKLNKVFFSIPRTALQGLFSHSQTPSVL